MSGIIVDVFQFLFFFGNVPVLNDMFIKVVMTAVMTLPSSIIDKSLLLFNLVFL